MEQERKKLQDEFDTKLVDSGRKLQEAKTESEALLNEMDKTGQAYEEMQEQNIRLIQQVRDKDKEYFSLFQERIKISNLQVCLVGYVRFQHLTYQLFDSFKANSSERERSSRKQDNAARSASRKSKQAGSVT